MVRFHFEQAAGQSTVFIDCAQGLGAQSHFNALVYFRDEQGAFMQVGLLKVDGAIVGVRDAVAFETALSCEFTDVRHNNLG